MNKLLKEIRVKNNVKHNIMNCRPSRFQTSNFCIFKFNEKPIADDSNAVCSFTWRLKIVNYRLKCGVDAKECQGIPNRKKKLFLLLKKKKER